MAADQSLLKALGMDGVASPFGSLHGKARVKDGLKLMRSLFACFREFNEIELKNGIN